MVGKSDKIMDSRVSGGIAAHHVAVFLLAD